MASEISAARWLADHVGADWLHVAPKSNDVVGANFMVTLRFENSYCQSVIKLNCDYPSYAEMHRTLLKRISQIREEFFLLEMHTLPLEEGVKLETELRT